MKPNHFKFIPYAPPTPVDTSQASGSTSELVFMTYGPLKDAKTGLPLFNATARKIAKNILELITPLTRLVCSCIIALALTRKQVACRFIAVWAGRTVSREPGRWGPLPDWQQLG
jgi:hypothetical protein